MEYRILPRSFYTGEDATIIAKELLGKVIITNFQGESCAGIIVETEAYMGPDDLACHAHSNRYTPRTSTLYEIGGTAYVYICYGIHHLFNAVTGKKGMGHAVLIRAVEPLYNESIMMTRRKKNKMGPVVTNGPGKLSAAMGISKSMNGIDLTHGSGIVTIAETNLNRDFGPIDAGPRVGMSHHTRHCGHYPWRFKFINNRWTSKPDTVTYDW